MHRIHTRLRRSCHLAAAWLFWSALAFATVQSIAAGYSGLLISATAVNSPVLGEELRIEVKVKNTGTNYWDGWGVGQLSGNAWFHFYDGDSWVAPDEVLVVEATCRPWQLPGQPGTYLIPVFCRFYDEDGKIHYTTPRSTDVSFRVIAPQPPLIQTQPVSQVVSVGTDVAFTVAATGSGQLSYQWSKDGAALSGQTQPTLKLLNVKAADAGLYTVLVSSPSGTKASEPALLTVVSVTPANWEIAANPSGMEISLTVTGGELNWVVANPCASWITIAPMSGSGSSALSVAVSANGATTPRGCALTIASQPFTVNQAGRTVPGVVHVNGTYTGSNSDGSPERPYRTVAAGYEAALNGDTICIFGTNYNEAITMSNPLILQGTNGVVTIGIP